jgi:hypothetical protein
MPLAGNPTVEAPPLLRKKKYDVYISYSHKDTEWVDKELIPHLKKARISIFVDSSNLKPGDQWTQILSQGILESRSVLLVVSESYFASQFTQKELESAINQSKVDGTAIIPVRIYQVRIPDPLYGIYYIDFINYQNLEPEKQDKLWNDLISTIRKARASVRHQKTPTDTTLKVDNAFQNTGVVNVTLAPVSVEATGQVGKPTIVEKPNVQTSLPEEEIEIPSRALSDTYSEEDLLGYQDYVDALADFIQSPETKKPLTIGIDAPWGGGKTTIMRMLEKRLGPQPKPRRLWPWQREVDGKIKFSPSLFWPMLVGPILWRWRWQKVVDGKIQSPSAFFLEKVSSMFHRWWQMLTHPKSWRWPWQKKEVGHFYTVWFNAWQYDQEEVLWAALVLETLTQVRLQVDGWRRIKIWAQINGARFKWDDLLLDFVKSFFAVVTIVILILAILSSLTLAFGLTIQDVVSTWIPDNIKILAGLGLASVLPLIYTIFKDITGKIISPFSLGVAKYLKEPDYKNKIGFLGQFQDDFKSVVATTTKQGMWPLLIFIDDLDRCTPSKAAAVIESINLLLDSQYCVFIIGMDAHVLAGSIQAKYKDLQEFFRDSGNAGGLSLGRKFLEKIIQIDFRIPSPNLELIYSFIDANLGRPISASATISAVTQAESLIQAEQRAGKSLGEAKQSVQQSNPEIASAIKDAVKKIEERSFDNSPEVQKTVREAAPYLDYNPRKIKRYINLYRLQALIAYRCGVLEDTVSLDILGRWILINLRWPEFFEVAIERPEFVNSFVEFTSKLTNAKTSAKRKALLESVSDPLLNRDGIRQLFGDQNILQLLSGMPCLPEEVKNYLQMIQVSNSPGLAE